MIRRITDVSSVQAQAVFALRQQFLTAHPHEIYTPMEQLVGGTAQGLFHLLSIEREEGVPVGFAVLHSYHWGGTPVLWLDEVYLAPAARGQGLFAQFIAWCGQYCAVSGVPTMMTNVWTKAEGAPFTKHVGAQPVALTLRMLNPAYTTMAPKEEHDEHSDPDSGSNGKQPAPRQKPPARRRTPPHRPRYPEGLAGEVSE